MLANLRRKIGTANVGVQPQAMIQGPDANGASMATYADNHQDGMAPPLAPPPMQSMSLEDFGFSWPEGTFSPTDIPLWLQEAVSSSLAFPLVTEQTIHKCRSFDQNLSDLGMPTNAYDGIFIPMNTGWGGDVGIMPEAW